ncbi:MgtC/SapB family protein [Acetobacter farinalis]|uniref:Protein MgtC n=1 Tax=Acetobacter farinalis TaxID=1260984 RepID=A0ABT3Q9T9_9PROT|nr:MgtC/SapB family protein [Acetobacter farinalis]MCX2562055.1 MgtC/SapB family protein [Acetobacter farinalis]NHO30659.1 MgtC/SapB family protein [Acetobacter farinalis]
MHFITTFNLTSFADSTASLLGAFVLGALIGAERQYRQRTAGIRTNALVALGAAAFVDLAQRLAGGVESLKVIAYVVSGVGFIGAGTIIKDGASVRGMNTAATLWCSAAVGACTGADMLAEGALLTFFVIAGNTVLRLVVPLINCSPFSSSTEEDSIQLYIETTRAECPRIAAMLGLLVQDAGYTANRMRFTNEGKEQCIIQISLLSSENTEEMHVLIGNLMTDPAVISCRSIA